MAISYGAQLEFARAFAQYSGMDGNVVLAWCLQEQPPGSPAYPGSNDWLNIEAPGGIGGYEEKRIGKLGPVQAAAASVEWMRKYQPSILASKGKGYPVEIAAIVNSGWAASKYGGVAKFTAVFREVAESKLPATSNVAPQIKGSSPAQSTSNPTDHSAKTMASGKQLSIHGQHISGVAAQMTSLRTKMFTPHIDTRRRNIRA